MRKFLSWFGLLAFLLVPTTVLAEEESIKVYETHYEDGTVSPVTADCEGISTIYANGTSLIFKDGKMYEDLAPLGEYNEGVDKRIYSKPYIEGLEDLGYDGQQDYEWNEVYIRTGSTETAMYGDYWLTISNTNLRGFYIQDVEDTNVSVSDAEITRIYLEIISGDANLALSNVTQISDFYVADTEVLNLGGSGGYIQGNLTITLDNVGDEGQAVSFHSFGEVNGDTSLTIRNSNMYTVNPAHDTGMLETRGNVYVSVENSQLQTLALVEKDYTGMPGNINGDIEVHVKDSTIELGISQYASSVPGSSAEHVVNGTATVYVENSTVRDINDRGGYNNSDSISPNTKVYLTDVEVEHLVTNQVNINGTLECQYLTVNEMNLLENATYISGMGNGYILDKLSGVGTFKFNMGETSHHIYFAEEYPFAKGTKVTLVPVYLDGKNYVAYNGTETIPYAGQGGVLSVNRAASILEYFECKNYELGELIREGECRLLVLNPCAKHNYKLAKSSGDTSIRYQANLYDKEATCTKSGVTTYYCTECYKVKYETTKALGHAYTKKKVEPTTKSEGYTLYKCEKCGYSYKGNYVDKLKSLTKCKFTIVESKAYTGKAIKPTVTVKDGKTKLKSGTHYTVTYKNNKNIGKATVTIKGKNGYTGTKKVTFEILPKKTNLSSVKSTAKKEITVKWKMDKNVTGYVVEYSLDKNFKKKVQTVKIKKNNTTSKKITKLKSGKTYYVRIAGYKTVKGATYTGAYSSAKKVRVK